MTASSKASRGTGGSVSGSVISDGAVSCAAVSSAVAPDEAASDAALSQTQVTRTHTGMHTGAHDGARIIGGRYVLLSVVGRGGMSTVYAARDVTLNKLWAVKQCRARDGGGSANGGGAVAGAVADAVSGMDVDVVHDAADDAGARMREAFREEAAFIKRFDHPCIPRIVDFVEDGGFLYVVMDYVEGMTLRDALARSGPQSAETVTDWALQLCDVLEYLHGRTPPVVHRDIKPGNIMVTPEGRVRLIDFGIAHTASMAQLNGKGTPGFSAPEQFEEGGAADDPRVDVYALGATMYAALTGRHPSRGIDWNGVACPPGLRDVVERCMETDPCDRFASCAHVVYALAHCDDGDYQATLRKRWKGFGITALAAALALGASPCCAVAAQQAQASDYSQWMMTAELAASTSAAWQAYQRAIDISPAKTEPYEGMIRLAKADGVLDSQEEASLTDALTAHGQELARGHDGWGQLCYDMGVLYWYYADASGVGGIGGNDDASSDDVSSDGGGASSPRGHAMASAALWMKQAVQAGGFADVGTAQVYADLADFSTSIVQRVNEGTDRGLYARYFANLERLIDAAGNEANPVVALTAAGQASMALQVYPRHFRYDGIAQERMERLESSATQLAVRTEAIGTKQTDMKQRVLRAADDAHRAVEQAFADPGAGDEAAQDNEAAQSNKTARSDGAAQGDATPQGSASVEETGSVHSKELAGGVS